MSNKVTEALEYLLSGALREACMYDDPDCDATFHCCDWNIAVDKIRETLAALESGKLVVVDGGKIQTLIEAVSTMAEIAYGECSRTPEELLAHLQRREDGE